MPSTIVPVLVHGFLGFDRIGPLEYFRGVDRALRSDGLSPLIPRLPPASSIAERAAALAAFLRPRSSESFVLIGHSMGGLDARYLAANLDPDRRVKSLITVATPHLGTPIARRMLDGHGPLSPIGRRFWRAALRDLTPETRRDEPIPDRPDVFYGSHAAARPRNERPCWLAPVVGLLSEENDGLVPLASAAWGESRETARADHFEVVGWSLAPRSRRAARPFDHIRLWRQAVSWAISSAKAKGEAKGNGNEATRIDQERSAP